MSLEARLTTLIAVVVMLLGLAIRAWAGAPTDQLRTTIDDVLRILHDPVLAAPAQAAERQKALRRAIEERFAFRETARRALGVYWRHRSPGERRRFTDLFTRLLERSYIARIEDYRGQVTYLGESVAGDYATVHTSITTSRGTSIPIDYELRRQGDRWLVYDVQVEQVSLIDNYRSQFRDIIATSSYHALVKRIEAKLEAPARPADRVSRAKLAG